LEIISQDRTEAWDILSRYLKSHPAILKDWFRRKRSKTGPQYSDDFWPNTRANFAKLCKLAHRILPNFKLSNIRR